MKINCIVREELESFVFLHGISVLFILGSTLISSSTYRREWLIVTALVIISTSLTWFYFKTSKSLDVRYLLCRSIITCFTLISMALALSDIWLTGGNSNWWLALVLLLSFLGPTIGILARIYEPSANFETCLKRGRFTLQTCKFNPSAHYGNATKNNPVLRALGMSEDVESNRLSILVKKNSVYSALGALFFGSLRSIGNPGFFEALLLALGIFCGGYLYFYIYVADLYFCAKASRTA
ncbi:hypothetical protein [Ferrimonas kyonanensis]|uniref:hypothetical protein n=1 Tax=Ferrimonas kyonanensis TaxID=364763 RepID=UPI0012EC53E4|nr:hypothetical protein [Ferrimonas kyonanensis]